MSTQELFPADHLVRSYGQKIYTTSRIVAKKFGKLHKDVLESIRKIISDIDDEQFGRRNFPPSVYRNEQDKLQPEYHLTEEGFALLVMGFTGREAMQWKVSFLEAFRALERQLRELTDQKALVLDSLHPHWPVIRDGTLQGLSRQQLCDLTGHKNPSSITANRRRLRELGLLPATSGQVDIITH